MPRQISISPHEHCQRIQALQQKIRARGLELFIVSSFESIFYLTGAGFEPLERPFFLLVKSIGQPVLLVPKLDQQHMTKAHGIEAENIITYREYPAPPSTSWPCRLKELLPSAGPIGVEPTIRREITDQLEGVPFRTDPLIEELRLIKSPAEVEMIRRASRFADFGVERLLAASYFGSTVAEGFVETRTVSARIIREVTDWDALTTKVLMATWPAPRSAMPHSVPRLEERLEAGPHVALALARVNGYSAESERTYFTQPPQREAQIAYAAMMEARELAFSMLKPGLSCHELDLAINEFLNKEGYGNEDQRLHRTGHGIGLGTHEGPFLAEGSGDRLTENMVISVEPGIYLNGVGGIRHSDTVLITKNGHQRLTQAPSDLASLTITEWKPVKRLKGLLLKWSLRLDHREQPTAPSWGGLIPRSA